MALVVYTGILTGHRDWVTALQCPPQLVPSPIDSEAAPPARAIISSSRDKSVVVWAARAKSSNRQRMSAIAKYVSRNKTVAKSIPSCVSEREGSAVVPSASHKDSECLSTVSDGTSALAFLEEPLVAGHRFELHSAFVSDVAVSHSVYSEVPITSQSAAAPPPLPTPANRIEEAAPKSAEPPSPEEKQSSSSFSVTSSPIDKASPTLNPSASPFVPTASFQAPPPPSYEKAAIINRLYYLLASVSWDKAVRVTKVPYVVPNNKGTATPAGKSSVGSSCGATAVGTASSAIDSAQLPHIKQQQQIPCRQAPTTAANAKKLLGHTHDILSVCFSSDDRLLATAGRDCTIRIWSVQSGACLWVSKGKGAVTAGAQPSVWASKGSDHTDWVGAVKFSPKSHDRLHETLVSVSLDGSARVWSVAFTSSSSLPSGVLKESVSVDCRHVYNGHRGQAITALAISPDGSLCATGGKDGGIQLWDLGKCMAEASGATPDFDKSILFFSLSVGEGSRGAGAKQQKLTESTTNNNLIASAVGVGGSSSAMRCTNSQAISSSTATVTQLLFSPKHFWLTVATEAGVLRIFDLESAAIIADLVPENLQDQTVRRPTCTSVCWSADGSTLYSGYTDNTIRVWRAHKEE